MKNFLTLAVLLIVSISLGQDINFKKGEVLIDDKPCLKYDSDGNNISYSSLDGTDLFVLKFIRVNGQLYNKIIFMESQRELTTQSYIFTKKILIDKLLKVGALENCALNEEKVLTFIAKFDEKVEQRNNQNTNTTIIIKDEPRPRNGININLGR